MKHNTWKYGSMKLSRMTYTFECDNEMCKRRIICLLSKYDDNEYFGKCSYCGVGKLKWIKNISLRGILHDANIIYKK